MPPKGAAEKKPAAAKAPAQKAPAEKKDAGKKTAATGDKKKRTKTRKETYSSYIYKGMISPHHFPIAFFHEYRVKPSLLRSPISEIKQ
jgi:histone H2B